MAERQFDLGWQSVVFWAVNLLLFRDRDSTCFVLRRGPRLMRSPYS